jgi:hypothetical protein
MESRTAAARDGAEAGSCAKTEALKNKQAIPQYKTENRAREFIRECMAEGV